jgi:predicted aldo/keto reductase-like oxidoreductase
MNKTYLSDSGPKVSPAIYGFYRWQPEDLKHSQMERIIDLCLELGINTFDHADIYAGYNADILEMNNRIKIALQTYCTAQYRFIDPAIDMPALFDAQGNLKDEHDDGDDAIHPNLNCYDTIINPAIRAKLIDLGVLS